MVKNKLKNETIYASCLLLFFLSFSYFYADFFNLNRNWTSQYDQEVAIAYNALLFNSALPQEYTDHTAYFLILSSSFYLKLMKLLGFLDIYKLRNYDEIFSNIRTRFYSCNEKSFLSNNTNFSRSHEKKIALF